MSTVLTKGQSINLSTGEVTDPPRTTPIDTYALSQWREDYRTEPLERIFYPDGTVTTELRGRIDREFPLS